MTAETAMTMEALPASRGDSLWVECPRPGERPWRLLVDGGMPESWEALRSRIERLPAAERVVDLAVVTHIDADHIGGMIPLFAALDLGVRYGDIWFNGLPQLPEDDADATVRSAAQGESLVDLLGGAGGGPPLPWNEAFGRAAVATGEHGAYLPVEVEGWPTLTLLSPTTKQLVRLRKVWEKELDRARRGETEEPEVPAAGPTPIADLRVLAEMESKPDPSAPNASSIAFLLEHRGASMLLTGDGSGRVLGAALTNLANDRGGDPIAIDVYKVAHHGSKGNVTPGLLAVTPASHYVLSSNGDRFEHPDDIAMARIILTAPDDTTLWFNYRTARNERWDEDGLKDEHRYRVRLPDEGTEGITLTIPAREGAP